LNDTGLWVRQRGVAVAELLTAVADERPLALLVDDLHWADAQSRQIMVGAANRLGVTHRLWLDATDSIGRPVALAPSVVRW
jgi:predicted ATPase